MKLFKYGLPFAALALLASCANDKLDGPTDNQVHTGSAYLNISIAMPRGIEGRAVDYTQDGDNNEYAVDDCKLYLFDTSGSCAAVLDLTNDFSKEGTPNDITSKATNVKVSLPEGFNTDATYNGLIIINTAALSSVPQIGTSWATWSVAPQTSFSNGDGTSKHFAMTNALGWAGDVTAAAPSSVLVEITANDFYYESETNSNPAKAFYVQRVAAKVSLTSTALAFDKYKAVYGTNEADKVKLENWWLNVVNENGYPVQTLGTWANNLITDWTAIASTSNTSHLDRFVSNAVSTPTFKRINWCEDYNYSGTGAKPTQYNIAPTNVSNNLSTNLYCFENTFDVTNMTKEQSTTAYFKATYIPNDEDDEIVEVDGTTLSGEAPSFIMYNKVIYVITDNTKLLAETSKTAALNTLLKETELASAQEKLNVSASTVVDFYYKGECYYTAIIRHFGNDETAVDEDWKRTTDTYAADEEYGAETTYGTDANFLGRYGVVRNNWYELSLNKISGPGKPTPPTPGTDIDDDEDPKVLDATVNILSWAKRTQDVEW